MKTAYTQVQLPLGMKLGTFVPCVVHDTDADTLSIYEHDCSVREESTPGSCLVVMRDNQTGEVVGLRIENYSLFRFHRDGSICDHTHWNWEEHGRFCTCCKIMCDLGD